jgi:uncharacterized damage-inducible protein DinB
MNDTRSPVAVDPIAAAQRDDGSLGAAELILAYESGPEAVRSSVRGLSIDQLRARPVAGRWSTLEVLCHLADSEQFFADRMKRTIALERPLLLGVDAPRYPEPLRYQDRDPEEEVALITLTRSQMARVLGSLGEEAWGRTAVHSETGVVTLRQLVLHAINHVGHHLSFVGEKKRALGLPES